MGKMQEKVERGFGRIRGLAKLTDGDEKAVGRDLRNSYHPFFVWLGDELQKLTSISPAWAKEVAEIEQDFREMDRNHDGNLDLKDLQKEVGKNEKDAVKFLHKVFDADGNGRIELKEAIALTWTIKHLPSCSCCLHAILPLVSQAYCCMACIDDVKAQHEQVTGWLYSAPFGAESDGEDDDGSGSGSSRRGPLVTSHNTTFLCKRCHLEKKQGCTRHGVAHMIPSHDRRLRRCVPAPAVLIIPGAEDNMHSCLCCGEKHSLVVSYLQPHLKDLHMRPVMVKSASGGVELSGFVCEFCAVRVCKRHKKDNVEWVLLKDARPGLVTLQESTCGRVGRGHCSGVGEKVDVAAEFPKREPAHCRTCAAKAAHKKSLLRPRCKTHGIQDDLMQHLPSVSGSHPGTPSFRDRPWQSVDRRAPGRTSGSSISNGREGPYRSDRRDNTEYDTVSTGPGLGVAGQGNGHAGGGGRWYHPDGTTPTPGGGSGPASSANNHRDSNGVDSSISFTFMRENPTTSTPGAGDAGGRRRLFGGGGMAGRGGGGVAGSHRGSDSEPETDDTGTSWSDSEDDGKGALLRQQYGVQVFTATGRGGAPAPQPVNQKVLDQLLEAGQDGGGRATAASAVG